MDSAINGQEKRVPGLNERVENLEQMLMTVKDVVMEIKEALPLREEREKSLLPQSLNKTASTPEEIGGAGREKGGVKKMTKAEIRLRMARSLCLLCDEKDSENHDCKNLHLQVLIVDDDDDETDEEEEYKTMMWEIKKALEMKSILNSSTAFKFRGKIGAEEVIVKISSASSHNFISKKVVAELGLPVERTRSFRVNFGFGHKAEGSEICKNVLLKAQGIEIVANFFSTNFGEADVMLGLDWLTSVGRVLPLENPRQTMTFDWHGRKVTLLSDPSLTKGMELGLMTLEWGDDDKDKSLGYFYLLATFRSFLIILPL